jgi:hypothetical protein
MANQIKTLIPVKGDGYKPTAFKTQDEQVSN